MGVSFFHNKGGFRVQKHQVLPSPCWLPHESLKRAIVIPNPSSPTDPFIEKVYAFHNPVCPKLTILENGRALVTTVDVQTHRPHFSFRDREGHERWDLSCVAQASHNSFFRPGSVGTDGQISSSIFENRGRILIFYDFDATITRIALDLTWKVGQFEYSIDVNDISDHPNGARILAHVRFSSLRNQFLMDVAFSSIPECKERITVELAEGFDQLPFDEQTNAALMRLTRQTVWEEDVIRFIRTRLFAHSFERIDPVRTVDACLLASDPNSLSLTSLLR